VCFTGHFLWIVAGCILSFYLDSIKIASKKSPKLIFFNDPLHLGVFDWNGLLLSPWHQVYIQLLLCLHSADTILNGNQQIGSEKFLDLFAYFSIHPCDH